MIKTFKKYNGKTRGLLKLRIGEGMLTLNIIGRNSHENKSREELKLIFGDIEEVMIENGFELVKTKR